MNRLMYSTGMNKFNYTKLLTLYYVPHNYIINIFT